MSRSLFVVLLSLGVAAAAAACNDDSTSPSVPTETFRATLNGANEVPARTTPATATADFTLRRDTLRWAVSMSSITNVTASHIHTGAPGVNGGIILPLTPGTSGVNNTLITGFVTRGTYQPPASPNQAVTFDSLLALMRNGNSYVNVHTSDPTKTTHNTGPGDFPGGEIRGQLAKTS
jgi:hypothetical protein